MSEREVTANRSGIRLYGCFIAATMDQWPWRLEAQMFSEVEAKEWCATGLRGFPDFLLIVPATLISAEAIGCDGGPVWLDLQAYAVAVRIVCNPPADEIVRLVRQSGEKAFASEPKGGLNSTVWYATR